MKLPNSRYLVCQTRASPACWSATQ